MSSTNSLCDDGERSAEKVIWVDDLVEVLGLLMDNNKVKKTLKEIAESQREQLKTLKEINIAKKEMSLSLSEITEENEKAILLQDKAEKALSASKEVRCELKEKVKLFEVECSAFYSFKKEFEKENLALSKKMDTKIKQAESDSEKAVKSKEKLDKLILENEAREKRLLSAING